MNRFVFLHVVAAPEFLTDTRGVQMSSLQILMQNLLYDISQIAIPWDRMDEEYLTTPKRWDSWDLLKFTLVLGPTSSVFDMCTYSLNYFYYGVKTDDSDYMVGMAQAHWFWQGYVMRLDRSSTTCD